MPYRDITDAQGNLLIRIDYYIDANPYQPDAMKRYKERVIPLHNEIAEGRWQTVVNDSASFFEIRARKYDECVTNPNVKDPRLWYGASARASEEAMYYHPANWPCNFLLLCHTSHERDERNSTYLRQPMLRGQDLRGKIGGAYQEMYRLHIVLDPVGKYVRVLQTDLDLVWNAYSMIDAPNPCWPDYSQLWNGQTPYTSLHVLLYGDYGSGKSTFAATWPKPMLVLCFDPPGKDLPYLNWGRNNGAIVSELIN